MLEKTTIKVKEAKARSFSEIYNCGLQYQVLTEHNECIHAPILCKDFLNDLFWGVFHDKRASIYGFTWDPKTYKKPDPKRLKVMLSAKHLKPYFSKTLEDVDIQKTVKFLRAIEKIMGVPLKNRSKAYKVASKKESYVVSSPIEWTWSLKLISMWSLLVRIGLLYAGENPVKWLKTTFQTIPDDTLFSRNDKSYIKDATKNILKLLELGFEGVGSDKKKNYPSADTYIGTVHNNGICKGWK